MRMVVVGRRVGLPGERDEGGGGNQTVSHFVVPLSFGMIAALAPGRTQAKALRISRPPPALRDCRILGAPDAGVEILQRASSRKS